MPRSNVVYFSFGGVDTRNYHILVDSSDTLVKPVRDMERIVIPGRSGGLTIDNNRFNDISITYHCHVKKGFDTNFNSFIAALHALGGERKLVDDRMETYFTGTYNGITQPGCYRKAIFDTEVQAEGIYAGYSGDFDITFTCKPQLWLNAGDSGIEVQQGTTLRIYNPTNFVSKPLLALYGKGTSSALAYFYVNGRGITVNVNSPYNYIYVDCELEDAYIGAVNCNSYIGLVSSGRFPECAVGSLGFTAYLDAPNSGSKMIIYPRWWTV